MARFDAFFGGSYQSQAVTADQERTVNYYPEMLQSPGATSRLVLYPTPGVQIIGTASAVGYGRAHYALNNQEFAIVGGTLYLVDTAGTMTNRGRLLDVDDSPATICGNGRGQFLITSGKNADIYDNSTLATFQLVTMNGKATMGDYLDGRFLMLDTATGTLYISAVFDGYTWTPGTDFARRTLAPDPWKAFKVVGRYIWLYGEETTEIWQDTGANFPFAPFPSSLLPYGIAAPFSAALVGNGVVWLARNVAGKRCVVYASGQNPEVISTYPLESALSGYGDVSSAVGDSYSDKGHTFYLLSLDEEPQTTFVWDLETKLWHERGTWRPEQNRFESWRPRFHAFAFGEHRTLDKAGAHVYRMSTDLTSDVDSLAIRRVRRAPAISEENKRVFYSSFELDVEPGLGRTASLRSSFTMAEQATYSVTVRIVIDGTALHDRLPGYTFTIGLWHRIDETVDTVSVAPAAPDWELFNQVSVHGGDDSTVWTGVPSGVYSALATPTSVDPYDVVETGAWTSPSVLVEADSTLDDLEFTLPAE